MKLYTEVYVGSYPDGPKYFVRDVLTSTEPCPLGQRYTSNIDSHINHRAGLHFDINRKVSSYGIVKSKQGPRNVFIRMYGVD